MRGAIVGAVLMALACCAPASALDVTTPLATVSCDHQDDTSNPPHESTIDSCAVDSDATTAACISDQESGGDTPSTAECTAATAAGTVDCTRYETFVYASNDDIACTAGTARDTATCETDHSNDFFATGDSSRVSGCTVGDLTSCYVTTRPDTDPIDPAFPVPDGTTPSITPSADCPAP